MENTVIEKRKELERRSIFLGGPKYKFVSAGRGQLEMLLSQGLTPEDRVLDVGCGALRGGWWSINFLRPGCYFGIEPNKEMLQAGIEVMLGPDLLAEKKPAFSNNDQFDFSVFGQIFDFVIARSIWTHAAKNHIDLMLASFAQCSHEKSLFLASMKEPGEGREEYAGTEWLGRSHKSDVIGQSAHRFSTIESMCEKRGLVAESLSTTDDQLWTRISRATTVEGQRS